MKKKTIWIIAAVIVIGVIGIAYYVENQVVVSQTKPMKLPVTIGLVKYLPLLDLVEVGFKQGMKDLGYVEGRDVIYIEESSNGNPDLSKLNTVAKDLIAQGANMLYAFPVESARAAYQETKAEGRTDIPVFASVANDPVNWGIVNNYTSSGNNVATLAIDLSDITAKRLEFLKELAPSAKKILIILPKDQNLTGTLSYQEMVKHAPDFGFELVMHQLQNSPGPAVTAELQQFTASLQPGDVDAWMQIPDNVLSIPQNLGIVLGVCKKLKIPSGVLAQPQMKAGGLFYYGYNLSEAGKQSARLVDKIIKGTPPSNIPAEFPLKDDLGVNLVTAQAIGLTIPQSILSLATEVVSQ